MAKSKFNYQLAPVRSLFILGVILSMLSACSEVKRPPLSESQIGPKLTELPNSQEARFNHQPLKFAELIDKDIQEIQTLLSGKAYHIKKRRNDFAKKYSLEASHVDGSYIKVAYNKESGRAKSIQLSLFASDAQKADSYDFPSLLIHHHLSEQAVNYRVDSIRIKQAIISLRLTPKHLVTASNKR